MDTSQLTEFLVYIVVKPGQEDAFLQGAHANREGSIREPGNLRFEMYRNSRNPYEFLFAEKYDSIESVTAHRQTPHFLAFFKVLEQVQQLPRRREPGNAIPADYKPLSNTLSNE
jgi:autoinducer 2-degrading protein